MSNIEETAKELFKGKTKGEIGLIIKKFKEINRN